MIRVLAIVTMVLASAAALAQGEPPKGEGAGDERRYQFNPVEGGTLRLDTKSGQVSLCSRRAAGWVCALVADDRIAFEQEIDRLQADKSRLQADNGRLAQALLDRGAPLPDTHVPPPKERESSPAPRGDDLDRMMSTLERVWRRLVDMIVNLQKEMGKS